MECIDVAIVGGGPAGSSAGAAAAAAGADTVIIEKGVPRADRKCIGPDSTDAAGFLDYWVDIAEIDYRDLPDGVILQPITSATFFGPTERVVVRDTGIDASYPHFGFTFHRARFDDWLRRRAENAGAEYRIGTGVRNVDSTVTSRGHHHVLTLRDGTQLRAEYVVLADGPQRTVTIPTLNQFVSKDRSISDLLGPSTANHIAYQEYRRFPEAVFEPDTLKFWWGWMPGETAYPWIFPNDGATARVGLTMPFVVDIDAVDDPEAYRLLQPDDEHVPRGSVYIRRLLEELYGDEYDTETEFPLVEDRGKSGGIEAYPISSTKPIDSPTAAGIAVTGGAMGATSPFHEGGGHVAIRSGTLAGRLAAERRLEAYNDAWKAAIGTEVSMNVAAAKLVEGYAPRDWNRALAAGRRIGVDRDSFNLRRLPSATGLVACEIAARYGLHRWRFRNGGYVQLREDEYVYR